MFGLRPRRKLTCSLRNEGGALQICNVRAGKFLTTLLALSTLAAGGGDPDPNHQKLIDEIERKVTLPAGAKRLDRYARYYLKRDHLIEGHYVANDYLRGSELANLPPGHSRWLDDPKKLPLVRSRGCSHVTVTYDPETLLFLEVSCGKH